MVSLKIFSLVALLVGSSFAAPNLPLPLQERKDEASGSILVRTLDVPAVERGVKFIQRRIPETSITDIESPGGVMLRDSGARKWLAMETDLTIDESAVPGGQNKRQLPDTNPTMANGGDPVPFANGGAMKAKRPTIPINRGFRRFSPSRGQLHQGHLPVRRSQAKVAAKNWEIPSGGKTRLVWIIFTLNWDLPVLACTYQSALYFLPPEFTMAIREGSAASIVPTLASIKAQRNGSAPHETVNGPSNNTNGTFNHCLVLAANRLRENKGGVIMDVVNAQQARIAEEAGACAVMALERVPADIRATGGVARMYSVIHQSDPKLIKEIIEAVTIPVMAKVRIGHFVEAQIIQAIGADYIDESEVLTPADEEHHINKHDFRIPFVCGATSLGEALRRISEGAAMIRTKGEAGTGNVLEASATLLLYLTPYRELSIGGPPRAFPSLSPEELYSYAKEIGAPYELLKETARLGRLPVVSFAAGGVATPADAAMMMQLGCDGVFVGSGIFLSGDPAKRARAIVQAVTHYNDPKVLAEVSEDLGEAMVGLTIDDNLRGGRFAGR
ncbi:SOR/SNZ family-domain-containing protein [Cantharellus anzutake]|uniref:SOR/SNZ family-domain-containing protein n=1 Tax=Cantharellus anzutake TaxID=1750568 RepID=UPI00190309CA|nr:SOR/SNZ family-domain-containing protein [Cantharellus anzutake]KAF8337527.1 SOR/SNZ family-domain-containing protein [Cantharellus anzutake]